MKVKSFIDFLDRRVDGFGGAQYRTFGIFGVINYPLGYYILHLLGADESIVARLVATFICAPLIFFQYWPILIKKYLNLYWFIALLYCLPVFGVYTLLRNQVSVDWLLNLSIGLFLLFLLVDYILLLIIYALGTILGFLLFIGTGQEVIFQQGFPTNFIYIYVTMIILGCIFAKNKENFAKEKLHSMKALAGAIAHEMRTPLSSLTLLGTRLSNHLPNLIKDYQKAQEANITTSTDKRALEAIQGAPLAITSITRKAFTIIDMLLMKLKENPTSSFSQACSISECVEESLKEYPFSDHDKSLISWKKEPDFLFQGSSELIMHVFFNLLKNALHYIKVARKGEILIWTEEGLRYNTLHFKDTGKGIPSHMVSHVFERFYTKTEHGTGIGLAFCKRVMEDLGGSITCHSIEGEYAEFILNFPKLKG